MKVGFIGGIILLILTLIFSYIAIENNKMARKITINAFDLQKAQSKVREIQSKQGENNDTNIIRLNVATEIQAPTVKSESKLDRFNEKFKNFDEKFKDF